MKWLIQHDFKRELLATHFMTMQYLMEWGQFTYSDGNMSRCSL